MTTRISKIARLPHSTREQLNRRLQNGEIGRTLLPWLNSLPETKKVLAELFNSKPITHQNLSEWRYTGYQDWLVQQQRLFWFQTLTEQEGEINQHDHSTDTFEAMSNYFIFELGQAITNLREIKNSDDRLNRLETLTREFGRLQNSFNWSRRVQLEWSKYNDTLPEIETSDNKGGVRVPSSPEQPLGALASRRREDDTMQIEAPEQNIIEIQPEPSTPERQRTGALQDAPRIPEAPDQRANVLECGSPLPLSASNSLARRSEAKAAETPRSTPNFAPIPTPAPTPPPAYFPPVRLLNSQTPKLKNSQTRPLRGRRFVCIEG